MKHRHFQQFLMRLYQTDMGKGMLMHEKALIDYALRKAFGLYLLQIGLTSWRPLLESCRLNHKILIDDAVNVDFFDGFIRADLDYLPIRKDSVDMVFLPHTLETVEDPYHLLRQIDELLIPEGRVMITGFNPVGCAILLQKFGIYRQNFKRANLISPTRVVEWLNVLGYEIEWVGLSPTACLETVEEPSRFSLQKVGGVLSWMGLETGNIYCIVAKKRISSPTQVGLNWKLSDWVRVRKGVKGMSIASNRHPSSHRQHKLKQGNKDCNL